MAEFATGNRGAFLDMLAFSEIGPALEALSDRGYNVLVGSTPQAPKLFEDYADHPRVLVKIREGLSSTAAGRYQLLARYYDAYKRQLQLPDFSPKSQDMIALQQIGERGALQDVDAGRISQAVAKVKNIWASLPGAGYGQHENRYEHLAAAYRQAGGMLVA